MDNPIRFGLIGYKFMGKAHSNALARIPMFFSPDAQIERRALCGRDARWAAQAAQQLGWDHVETDWRALIAREDIDAVDIAAPSDVHKDIAIAAAQAGKHIFCEKPLALNLADAREILAAAEQAGVKHQIGFNYRFAPAVLLAKRMIEQGLLGRVFHFRGLYLQDFIIDPAFPKIWRLDKKVAGSGSLGDLGAHVIDLARFLVGNIAIVAGMSETFIKERPLVESMTGLSAQAVQDAPTGVVDVDDATQFVCRFHGGAMGTFEATRYATGHKNAMSFEINAQKGSLRFDLERMNELQYYNADDPQGLQGWRTIQVTESVHPYCDHWWPTGHVIGYEHTFVHELYEFVQSIANDSPCSPDFSDGVKCSQILEAVERSIDERRWIDVDSL